MMWIVDWTLAWTATEWTIAGVVIAFLTWAGISPAGVKKLLSRKDDNNSGLLTSLPSPPPLGLIGVSHGRAVIGREKELRDLRESLAGGKGGLANENGV